MKQFIVTLIVIIVIIIAIIIKTIEIESIIITCNIIIIKVKDFNNLIIISIQFNFKIQVLYYLDYYY